MIGILQQQFYFSDFLFFYFHFISFTYIEVIPPIPCLDRLTCYRSETLLWMLNTCQVLWNYFLEARLCQRFFRHLKSWGGWLSMVFPRRYFSGILSPLVLILKERCSRNDEHHPEIIEIKLKIKYVRDCDWFKKCLPHSHFLKHKLYPRISVGTCWKKNCIICPSTTLLHFRWFAQQLLANDPILWVDVGHHLCSGSIIPFANHPALFVIDCVNRHLKFCWTSTPGILCGCYHFCRNFWICKTLHICSMIRYCTLNKKIKKKSLDLKKLTRIKSFLLSNCGAPFHSAFYIHPRQI